MGLLGGLLVEEDDVVSWAADGDLGPDLFDPVGLKLIVAKLAFDMDQGSLLQALLDRIDLAFAEDFDGVPGGALFALTVGVFPAFAGGQSHDADALAVLHVAHCRVVAEAADQFNAVHHGRFPFVSPARRSVPARGHCRDHETVKRRGEGTDQNPILLETVLAGQRPKGGGSSSKDRPQG